MSRYSSKGQAGGGQVRLIAGEWRGRKLPVPDLPGCVPPVTVRAKPSSTGCSRTCRGRAVSISLPAAAPWVSRRRAAALRTWTDAELDEPFLLKEVTVSKGWILYHVLEHMVAHYGQILLLQRLGAAAP